MFSLKFQSAPGSIGQVRESATQLLFAAKGQNIPTFLVGHVTKDGSLAGPKALEHIVDTVLYFEGEKHHAHRVVRAVKNRFGAVSELGVFEMTGTGLRGGAESVRAVPRRAARRTRRGRRCCAASKARGRCSSKCRRSSARSTYGNARRMASGIDQNRLSLLLAVLEKRAGLNLIAEDVFVNVAGGMTVDEPAADLAIIARRRVEPPQPPDPRRHGGVRRGRPRRRGPRRQQAALRVREAAQMGFTRCVAARRQLLPGRRRRRASSSSASRPSARRSTQLIDW